MGGQPVPHQGRLLPAERPAQLTKRADQAVGVVGVELVVEGQVGAATATVELYRLDPPALLERHAKARISRPGHG